MALFRSLDSTKISLRQLVQANEVGATEVVLPKMLDALLTHLDRIDWGPLAKEIAREMDYRLAEIQARKNARRSITVVAIRATT